MVVIPHIVPTSVISFTSELYVTYVTFGLWKLSDPYYVTYLVV